MSTIPSKNPGLSRWITVLWLLLLALYIAAGTPLTPFHGDESTQIYMGRDYYYHMQNDWQQLNYSDPPVNATEQHLRLLNGTLSKYLFGGIAYHSGYSFEQINEQWDWGADWHYNETTGHIPSDSLLMRSRAMSTIALIVSMGTIFFIGYSIQGRETAYLASLLYTLHPVILLAGRRAMMEGTLLCFSLLLILTAIYMLKNHQWWQYILVGVFSGLCVASKHTGVFVVLSVFITGILYPLWQTFYLKTRTTTSFFRHFIFLSLAGLLALGIFYGLNPAWWGDPIHRAQIVLSERQALMTIQIETFDSYPDFLSKVRGWWEQVMIAQPMYYEVAVWQDYIGNAIMRYEQSGLAGIPMGGTVFGSIVLAGLILFGLVRLIRNQAIDGSTSWLLLIWMGLTVALTLFITPLAWQRYYIPMYPILIICLAISLQQIVAFGWRQWQTR